MRSLSVGCPAAHVMVSACVMLLVCATLPSWALHLDRSDEIPSVRSTREALSPPTVTSLRPPNRSGGSRSLSGLTVRGEEGDDNGPPVVASRSPASTSYSGETTRHTYVPVPTTHHRGGDPSSPLATAASGSRAQVDPSTLSGRRSLPSPAEPTPHNIPLDARVTSPWDRYELADEGARGVGTFSHLVRKGGEDSVQPTDTGGLWAQQVQRRPSPQYGRADTFGHSISEDLSHLDREQHPRRSQGHTSGGHPSLHGSIGRYPEYPREMPARGRSEVSGGNFERHRPTHWNGPSEVEESSAISPWYSGRSETGNDRSSTRFRPPDQEVQATTSPRPSYVDYNAHEYPPRGSHIFNPHTHDYPRVHTTYRPITIQEITHMKNLSNTDELLDLLQRKGIVFRQLVEYIERGATRDEVLKLLSRPDIIPEPYNPYRHEVDLHLDSDSHFSQVNTMNENPYTMDDDDDTSKDTIEEQRKRNRKERKRNRERKNRRRKGKKGRGQQLPDLVYTTDILPVDSTEEHVHVEETQSLPTQTLEPQVSTSATTTEVYSTTTLTTTRPSTGPLPNPAPSQPTLFEEVPGITPWPYVPEPTKASELTPTVVQVFPEPPDATATMTLKPIAFPTFTTSEDSVITTSPVQPKVADATRRENLPPGKPSDVSILSITVMEAPIGSGNEETIVEGNIPRRHRPKLRKNGKMGAQPSRQPDFTLMAGPDDNTVSRINFVREAHEEYQFPIKGIMIISGVMGAMAVFTLVVLISYAIVKCSKPPPANNYQVNAQKPIAQ